MLLVLGVTTRLLLAVKLFSVLVVGWGWGVEATLDIFYEQRDWVQIVDRAVGGKEIRPFSITADGLA